MSVAFVREESAAAAQEVSLPPRAISAHPNLVTRSGLARLSGPSPIASRRSKPLRRYWTPTSAVTLWSSPRGMRAISRNALRARFRSLSRQTRSSLCSAPRSRSCATTVGARRSGSLARTRRIPAADRSPMCPRLPIGSLESGSVRPWRWMVAKLKWSQSNRKVLAAGPLWTRTGLPVPFRVCRSCGKHQGIHRARIA